MRLGWLTDVHLNFVPPAGRADLYARLRAAALDALLIGGDIAEAPSVLSYLSELHQAVDLPVYFVLGNHDFYHGSIREVRAAVARYAATAPGLHWLPASPVIALNASTCLIGHDSWADGRVGDFLQSEVILNDYVLIEELRLDDKRERLAQLQALGDEAAAFLESQARAALSRFRRVLVLTHVPPFRDACWHQGSISDGEYLPHFACQVVGDRLAAVMREHPHHQMTILCGHTHSPGVARILDNLVVITGGAEYGKPALQQILELE